MSEGTKFSGGLFMSKSLPEIGFLRLSQILGSPKADPPIYGLLPISRSSWFEGQRIGRFPKPVRIFGPRIALYRVEDIRKLIETGSAQSDVDGGGQ